MNGQRRTVMESNIEDQFSIQDICLTTYKNTDSIYLEVGIAGLFLRPEEVKDLRTLINAYWEEYA